MKTGYKTAIIILACLSSIFISYAFPQVFLIFHLDKYETNDVCDVLDGEWDWYYDLCNLPQDNTDKEYCEDIGGIPECARTCWAEIEWNPWKPLHGGCFSICYPACILDKNIQVQIVSNTISDLSEIKENED
ncbi:hypothetical protein K0U27_11275 [archaeon]|nr:hypothetical protein [archaeon]